jgi:hypothetical protein
MRPAATGCSRQLRAPHNVAGVVNIERRGRVPTWEARQHDEVVGYEKAMSAARQQQATRDPEHDRRDNPL